MNKMEFLTQLALAKAGNVNAMVKVANCYYNGDGVKKSYEEEAKWLIQAASKGHPQSNYNLGYY